MPYTITQSQRPLIGGLAGHNLIVVKNDAGDVIKEFDGLAADQNGNLKTIGYLSTDKLVVKEFNGAVYYQPNQAQQVVFSGTLQEVMSRVSAAEACANQMNANNMEYPFLGIGKNSNSVGSTLLKCMGIVETPIPGSASVMPGVGDILLPQSFIDQVKAANSIAGGAGTAWDTGTTYDNYYADLSHFDLSDNFGGGACVSIASFLPDGTTASDVVVGTVMKLADQRTLEPGTGVVTYSQTKSATGFRIVTQSGASLVCSDSAPIPTPEGLVLAPKLLGKKVAVLLNGTRNEAPSWETVVAIDAVGKIQVQHITVGDRCFWAGEKVDAYILHHNLKDAGGGGGEPPPNYGYLVAIDPLSETNVSLTGTLSVTALSM